MVLGPRLFAGLTAHRAQAESPIEEVSLGDLVLLGGEVAALAVLEATARLLPGVLGNELSASDDDRKLLQEIREGLLAHGAHAERRISQN